MIFVFLEFVKLLGGKRYIYPRVLRLIDITLAPRAVSLVRSASCGLPRAVYLAQAPSCSYGLDHVVIIVIRAHCTRLVTLPV